ncbi:hypothetical protein VI817_003319 [Penicillium citrinum]|uniref:Uncharacterized protein n=1 Tax=Penicillium hetheringtonii TaxID=911720 RepID=A0AAD6DP52_9EURO|nr:hypothetical protein N7450_003948 [Penicillium hetheringtonii]KAK5801107.1 hypothetical protein VI817_003319 [Penicillium citrinum]
MAASDKPAMFASGSQDAEYCLNTISESVGNAYVQTPQEGKLHQTAPTEDDGLNPKEQRETAQPQNILASSGEIGASTSGQQALASGSHALATVLPGAANQLDTVSRSVDEGVETLQGAANSVIRQLSEAQGREMDTEWQREAIQSQIGRLEDDLRMLKNKIHDFYLVTGAQIEYLVRQNQCLMKQANGM